MKKLEKKLKRTRNSLIGLGLSGILMLGGISGCGTLSSWDVLRFAAGSTARDENRTEKQRRSAAYLERIAREQAQRQHEKDLAEMGKDEGDEVNIYIEKEEKEKREEELTVERYFLACNYIKDFDKDGYIEYPDEYVGIKNRFRDNERISLVSYDEKTKKGQLWEMELYSPSGEDISNGLIELVAAQDRSGMCFSDNENFNVMNWLIQTSGYGNYRSVWRIDGNYVGSTEFEIIPSGK